MVAHDISRHLFHPANHYTGLRMQQGRVMLDSDFNEARMLDDEQQRLLVRDVIGPHGTPDLGFSIPTVQTLTYNFDIHAGTYYLGGLRHETSSQTFRLQSDWLQSNRVGADPAPPSLPVVTEGPRHDLVYMIGWEQGVTSVEDAEIREQAIAAQDTGYRVRRMHRVMVRPDSPADCADAFASLYSEWTDAGHSFDLANNELISGAHLTVTYNPEAAGQGDLCKPTALQGFSGAENETIRVQLIGEQRFLWGLDNAAPLYRVTVVVTEVLITVTFTTRPRDAAHQPRVGQVLEILPWGAQLSNGEHVADHPVAPDVGGNVLARVVTPYDPSDGTLTILLDDVATLEAMILWLSTKANPHLFARVWNPGDVAGDDDDTPVDDTSIGIPFVPGVPVDLAGTGLTVTFDKDGIVGDHWILAARPATTHNVVPWDLARAAPPHGPRRFYSPLAIIHWSFNTENALQYTVHDCRRTFRPLTRIRGCCTVTVGDGVTSFGDFTSINDAIRAIPTNEKGKVCILPGRYNERVVIQNRNDLVIEGCGARTLIHTPEDNETSEGLITVTSCNRITLRSFHVEAIGQFGVMLFFANSSTLEQLEIRTRRDPTLPLPDPAELWIPTGSSSFPLSTVAAYVGSQVTLRDCKLEMQGELGSLANVTLMSCYFFRIVGCRISTPTVQGARSLAWGGVYITYGSFIEITDNLITGGLGHGITFGTYISGNPPGHPGSLDSGTRRTIDGAMDCPTAIGGLTSAGPAVGGGGGSVTIYPSSNSNAIIRRNRIRDMGASGISVLGFWPDTTDPYPMISTSDLEIADNIIENNCQMPPHGPMPLDLLDVVAFGGIVLGEADNLRIHDNLIQNNGLDSRTALCGVYVLHGENIAIENNLIRANGKRIDDAALAGIRAGIAVQLAGRRITVDDDELDVEADSLRPAALIRGNVVEQPAGRALQLYGIGAMFVEGNTLTSEGLPVGTTAPVPHCVDIQNVGQSPEVLLEGLIPASIAMFPAPPLLYDTLEPTVELIDGRILFTANQVRFAPIAGTAQNIFCATRLQSYGDVAVLDNQFFTVFPALGGTMITDTIVTAWSTRTNNNRWEDPARELSTGNFETGASATTLAWLNFSTLNQASRCIHATIAAGAPTDDNPIAVNQTYTNCDPTPMLTELLAP